MQELTTHIVAINNNTGDKKRKIELILEQAVQSGLTVVEVNTDKPWGAYIRFDNHNIEQFIDEFFPGISIDEARLGNVDIDLSPKILFVSPAQRLSLQKHARRSELWRFLTEGAYYKSKNDNDPGELRHARIGEVVQFENGEIHRLCGLEDTSVLVAEIWQHVDSDHLSDEDDIVRLADDYSR